jgi:DNA-binding helix-hairpin-helix protein with protein kinase domain
LAAHGGPEYFYGVAGEDGAFVVDEEKLQDIQRRLTAVTLMDFPHDRDRYLPPNPPEPEPLPEGLEEHRSTMLIVGVAAAFGLVLMPFGLYRGFICVTGLLIALIFGVALAVLRSYSPWHRELRRRRNARRHALDDLRELEDEWERTVQRYRRQHAELNRSAGGLMYGCRDLSNQHQVELRGLSASAEANARLRHLRLHLIADADIPKIGAGRKQVLAANNVLTAADVELYTIRSIPGFGDALTGNLMAWKEKVLRQFRFDPTTAIPPADLRAAAMKYRARQQQIIARLAQILKDLGALAPTCQAALAELVPELKKAVKAWDEADADLRVLTRHQS